jgi:hypothetical protein
VMYTIENGKEEFKEYGYTVNTKWGNITPHNINNTAYIIYTK